jgi:hypothetical protein
MTGFKARPIAFLMEEDVRTVLEALVHECRHVALLELV